MIPVYDPNIWPQVTSTLKQHTAIVGAVVYTGAKTVELVSGSSSPLPVLQHIAGATPQEKSTQQQNEKVYQYPELDSFQFATPFHEKFHYSSETVSHTRNLNFLKKLMDGPYFDLEAIWEEHTYYEFEARSVPDTMSTMVQEPYVNHAPTVCPTLSTDNCN